MYYRQRGWKVTISRTFGFLFLIGISSCLLLSLADIWLIISEKDGFSLMVTATFFYLLMIFGLAVFAVYNLWRFPDLSISDKGIKLRVFFYTMTVEWDNISRLQNLNNGLLIFLKTEGFLLNRLYGLFDAKVWDQPVVLFVSDKETAGRVEQDIRAHLDRT